MLSKLVDDLYELSLADVGALTYRKQPLEVQEILGHSAAMYQERCHGAGLMLRVNLAKEPMRVSADPQRLQQLFGNLLENAVRYTDAGGDIRIEGGIEHEQILLTVSNSGPGVSDEQLAHLFERFYRGDTSRSRASGGAGLGLAICSSIAQAHGGTLTAEHSPLGGLKLTLRLPREA